MSRQPRFEVVHSDAGWFARFRASNGRKVWQTETYTRHSKAAAAVALIRRGNDIEVRDVDERTTAVTS